MGRPWILLIRDSGFYTTGMYIERALQKNYNVISAYVDRLNWIYLLPNWLSMRAFNRVLQMKAESLNIDMILCIDPVRKRFDFSIFNAPTAYYAIDCHVAFDNHTREAHVQDYDFVFVAQKDYIPKYQRIGCRNVYWLPLACDPEIHRYHSGVPLIYDACFVGNIRPGRRELFSKLEKEFKFFTGNRYLHDMAETYSQSKIVFNKSLKGDLNMRVFESMSCGRMLITDRISNGLEELFIDGRHLVIYDDYEDLVKKVRYYLENVEERERIALRGQKEVQEKHTYTDRMKYLTELVLGERVVKTKKN